MLCIFWPFQADFQEDSDHTLTVSIVQATDSNNEDLFAWHDVDMNNRGQCIQWLGMPSGSLVTSVYSLEKVL